MRGRLLFPLGRGLLALAFIGPGGMHLLEGWREQQMSASTAVALLGSALGQGYGLALTTVTESANSTGRNSLAVPSAGLNGTAMCDAERRLGRPCELTLRS